MYIIRMINGLLKEHFNFNLHFTCRITLHRYLVDCFPYLIQMLTAQKYGIKFCFPTI